MKWRSKGWLLVNPPTLFWSLQFGNFASFSVTLIFKNGFVGDIAFSGKEEIFTKSPLALF
jgi:hypothetical protein